LKYKINIINLTKQIDDPIDGKKFHAV